MRRALKPTPAVGGLASGSYMFRISDVAAYLGVSQQRGTQMHAEGKLPKPERVDSVGPLWKPTTIERWAEREWWDTRRRRTRTKRDHPLEGDGHGARKHDHVDSMPVRLRASPALLEVRASVHHSWLSSRVVWRSGATLGLQREPGPQTFPPKCEIWLGVDTPSIPAYL
jgi:hypothetical protein